MKRKEIVETLKKINSLEIENDGPTTVFHTNDDKKTITFSLSINEDFITVTTGKYLLKRKYLINRRDLYERHGYRPANYHKIVAN